MDKDFWLGLIGGIFGILGGMVAIVVGSLGEALTGSAEDLYLQGFIAIMFSTVGIIAPIAMDTKKWIGVLMIIAGIMVLIAISLFGVLTMILFIIGGAIALRDRGSEDEKQFPETPGDSGGGL